MKKVLMLVFLLVGLTAAFSYAGERRYDIVSNIGPIYVSSAAVAAPSITIAAPGPSRRNCLTYLVVTATNAFSTSILSGSTTIFFAGPTSANGNFFKEWIPEDPICSDNNSTMVIQSSATSAGNTTMHYSYKGFVVR